VWTVWGKAKANGNLGAPSFALSMVEWYPFLRSDVHYFKELISIASSRKKVSPHGSAPLYVTARDDGAPGRAETLAHPPPGAGCALRSAHTNQGNTPPSPYNKKQESISI